MTISSDGSQVISGSNDKTIRIWDANTNLSGHTLRGHSDSVKCLSRFDAETGQLLGRRQQSKIPISCLALSAEGERIFYADSDHVLHCSNPISGEVLWKTESHADSIRNLALSGDLKMIASVSEEGTLRLRETETGQCVSVFLCRGATKLAWNPTNETLVAGFSDGRVVFYQSKLLLPRQSGQKPG